LVGAPFTDKLLRFMLVRVEKSARWAEFIRDAERERVQQREQVIKRADDLLR
jgi:hypothetical protein